MLTPDDINAFGDLTNKISSEMIFAEKGKDEGLIPIYSLLSDLRERFPDVAQLQDAIKVVVPYLDALLDNASPFDEKTLQVIAEFNMWSETAYSALQNGNDFPPFKLSDAATGEKAEDSEEAKPASPENELLKYDTIQDLNLEENRELLVEFHMEAVDHLEQIESALLHLEQEPESPDAINSIFRSFHTIKGVAGFLHLTVINKLAHEVESLLDLVRNHQLALSTDLISLVLESRDTIDGLVGQVGVALNEGHLPEEIIPISHLIERVRQASTGEAPEIKEEVEEPSPTETAGAAEKPIPFPEAETKAEAPKAKPATAKKPATPAAGRNDNATIRVSTNKLDNLLDMVGELVIVQSQLLESGKYERSENNTLQRNLAQLTRITKELQHTSMALRMVPIKPTFQKMGRLIRDLAGGSGKKVTFHVSGEDTELDRNVVEEIGDPLVHMVRNSLDHGLEPPDARVARGKPETGNVHLTAYHQGSNIVIELTDDGRGINPEKVLSKAIEKGLVPENQNFTPEEIFQLIFMPGFSTADKITDISGRGVGMDVVKRNIERLRGKVEISSELGKGTTFKIKLPLTMAIIDGLVVRVGEDRFILPTTSVKLAIRPEQAAISRIQGKTEVLDVRGKTIPLFRLHQKFSIDTPITQPWDGTVVIVETTGRPCGLMVDEMVSKQEVVIKNLGSMMQGVPGIAGGAILGDGTIALILDPATLFSAA